jgi:hypothetical protein
LDKQWYKFDLFIEKSFKRAWSIEWQARNMIFIIFVLLLSIDIVLSTQISTTSSCSTVDASLLAKHDKICAGFGANPKWCKLNNPKVKASAGIFLIISQ